MQIKVTAPALPRALSRLAAALYDACEKRAGRVNGLAFTDLWNKPGTPVSTTILNRILVATPSRISCMASSGMVESSKFSWMRLGVD